MAAGADEACDLIRGYTIEMVEAKCRPGTNRFSLRLHLDQDIAAALPYLNAAWKAEFYDHQAQALTHDMETRHYAVRPREVLVAPVADRAEAETEARKAVARINDVWRCRAGVVPSESCRVRPSLMEIYRLLPRSNCGQCGLPSCMAFAAALRQGEVEPEACEPLQERDGRQGADQLRRLFPAKCS